MSMKPIERCCNKCLRPIERIEKSIGIIFDVDRYKGSNNNPFMMNHEICLDCARDLLKHINKIETPIKDVDTAFIIKDWLKSEVGGEA